MRPLLSQAAASSWGAAAASASCNRITRPLTAAGSRPSHVRTAATGGNSSSSSGVYLITGSTDGIGRHTALQLAQAGATVLVHGRNPSRVADTVRTIQKATNSSSSSSSSSGRVFGYTADLSDLSAVRRLAAEVARQHPRLTALVNNAGVYETQRRLSADGYEMTWAVNVLAPVLLTSLLWRHVEPAGGQIVTTASISAASHLDMRSLQQEQGYSAHGAYSLSKLCDIIFTLSLHDWLQQQGSSIRANTLDPGTVNTKMLLAGWGRIGIEVGAADNTHRLLTDPAVAGLSGCYFVAHRESRPPSIAQGAAVQQELWQLWTQQTGATWQA